MNQHARTETWRLVLSIEAEQDSGANGQAFVDPPFGGDFTNVLIAIAIQFTALVYVVRDNREAIVDPPLISPAKAPLEVAQVIVVGLTTQPFPPRCLFKVVVPVGGSEKRVEDRSPGPDVLR